MSDTNSNAFSWAFAIGEVYAVCNVTVFEIVFNFVNSHFSAVIF
jgi:hypothetical protein